MTDQVTQHALEAAKDYLRGNGPWKDGEIGITEDDYLVQCFAKAIREAKRQERAATFLFIREQAWKEEVVEAQQAVFGPDSHIRPPARLMVSLMNKAMLDQIERTQNDD